MNILKNNLTFEKIKEKEVDNIKNIEIEQNISILSKESIKNELNSTTSFYYVCKFENEIIGYVNFSIVLDTMELNSIVVKKDFKQKGIATYMLDKVINIAKEKNISKIFLEVRKSNIPAQNLYKKFNFKHINTRNKYYSDNLEDAYIYSLSL